MFSSIPTWGLGAIDICRLKFWKSREKSGQKNSERTPSLASPRRKVPQTPASKIIDRSLVRFLCVQPTSTLSIVPASFRELRTIQIPPNLTSSWLAPLSTSDLP